MRVDRPACTVFGKLVDCKTDDTRTAHSRSASFFPFSRWQLFTSDSSRRFSALRGCQYSPEAPRHSPEHSQPALVANRFKESSLSPFARTCPQNAKVVEVGSALPSASTSTMLICTDAWSLDVINWSMYFLSFSLSALDQAADELVAEHLRGT